MWRGRSRYFSRYTASSPKAALASVRAVRHASSSSSSERATFMPRPPPPAAALISTGYITSRATSRASSRLSSAPRLPGTSGTPSRRMASLAAILSPMMRMCSAVGPMKASPCASTISAKRAFSDRKP